MNYSVLHIENMLMNELQWEIIFAIVFLTLFIVESCFLHSSNNVTNLYKILSVLTDIHALDQGFPTSFWPCTSSAFRQMSMYC